MKAAVGFLVWTKKEDDEPICALQVRAPGDSYEGSCQVTFHGGLEPNIDYLGYSAVENLVDSNFFAGARREAEKLGLNEEILEAIFASPVLIQGEGVRTEDCCIRTYAAWIPLSLFISMVFQMTVHRKDQKNILPKVIGQHIRINTLGADEEAAFCDYTEEVWMLRDEREAVLRLWGLDA